LSLKPIEQTGDDQQRENTKYDQQQTPQQKEYNNNSIDLNDDTAVIQALFTGKLSPQDMTTVFPSPVNERLRQAKETMGDRLVIASVPKYDSYPSKGIKI